MLNKCTLLSIGVLFAVLSMFFCATAHQAKALSLQSFIDAYEAYAFPQNNGRLVKPSSEKSTVISVHCAPYEYCKVIIPKLNKFLNANSLSVIQVQEFDPHALISVEIVSGHGSAADMAAPSIVEQLNFPVAENENVYHEGTKECAYINTVAKQVVTHSIVVVNTIDDDRRYISCILFGLARSTGLNLVPTYELAWSKGGGLSSLTEQQFDQWMLGTARVIALHTNRGTFPSMTQSEFEKKVKYMSLQQMIGE